MIFDIDAIKPLECRGQIERGLCCKDVLSSVLVADETLSHFAISNISHHSKSIRCIRWNVEIHHLKLFYDSFAIFKESCLG